MTPDEAKTHLEDLEADWIEKTSSTTDTDKFGEAICAFANDVADRKKPGYLFLGVDKAGRPTGIRVDERLLERIAGIRSDGNLLPPPSMTVEKVELPQGAIVAVTVQPSLDTPVSYKGTIWIRVGPRSGRANREDERRLTDKRAAHLARTWDARPCAEATLEDIALELFALAYRQRAVDPRVLEENDRPLEQQLAALRLWDPRAKRPTNAALLLFGHDPLFFVPGAYVQYVRYEGTSLDADVAEDRRLAGDLASVLRGLDELGRDIAIGRPVQLDGFRESMVFDYPPRALRELFVNAVVHRNYETSTAPVSINHFVDRIEIGNPGGLFPDLTESDFDARTAYRNPILAEATRVLGYANRFGRGVAVARAELVKNGSPVPHFEIHPNYFSVIVGRRP